MPHYSTPPSGGEPIVTSKTVAIKAVHGQPAHVLILDCLNAGKTHREIAEHLSTGDLVVTTPWISWYIRQALNKRWEVAS